MWDSDEVVPAKVKTPLLSRQLMTPEPRYLFNLGSCPIDALRWTSASFFSACLASYATSWRLPLWICPPKRPLNTLSPKYDHLRTYLIIQRRSSTAVSLNRTPQCVIPCRTSSNPRIDQAPGSSPLYGRSQVSGSTGSPPVSCGLCRRPTRS